MSNQNIFKRPEKPFILVVDDMENNRKIIGARLLEEGYEISVAANGLQAVEMVELDQPDLILLDIDMPVMDGYETCKKLKTMEEVKDIPVIFFTAAKKETHDMVEGLKLGGVDYVIKQFDEEHMAVLLQRIKNHLEIKFYREEIQADAEHIESLYNKLNSELEKAAKYVASLIPEPINKNGLLTHWRYFPSAQLGGDTFGYHWLDDDNFAIYLLDVSGHGIGPSLHSVSVLNSIRNQTLKNADFYVPESVLENLNKSYPMADHNLMYFTMWYAVYNIKNHTLRHCFGGHPAAIMIDKDGTISQVGKACHIVGALADAEFSSEEMKIETGATIYIFSDGAFEVKDENGKIWTPEQMADFIAQNKNDNGDEIDLLYKRLQNMEKSEKLSDDFSMLKIVF